MGYDLRDLALDVVELPLDLGKLRDDLRRFVVAAEHQLEQRRASVLEGAPRRLLADEFQAGDQQVDGLERDVGFGGGVFRAQRDHILLEVLGRLLIGCAVVGLAVGFQGFPGREGQQVLVVLIVGRILRVDGGVACSLVRIGGLRSEGVGEGGGGAAVGCEGGGAAGGRLRLLGGCGAGQDGDGVFPGRIVVGGLEQHAVALLGGAFVAGDGHVRAAGAFAGHLGLEGRVDAAHRAVRVDDQVGVRIA